MTQVLINLVGNAIKFTDAGEVAIKAEANNGSFHVSVRDTGPGISSADQARLFHAPDPVVRPAHSITSPAQVSGGAELIA